VWLPPVRRVLDYFYFLELGTSNISVVVAERSFLLEG